MSLNGLFALRKPPGLSSAQVLNAIQPLLRSSAHFKDHLISRDAPGKRTKRRRLNEQKVKMGHGGTLDPMATGVLIVGVGSGTKQLNGLLGGMKEYEATCVFGTVTDSYDAVGKIVRRAPTEHITKEKVEEALEKFRGDILQQPPIFSALRINGKRAYEYARLGQELPKEIEKRPVTVTNLELLEWFDSHSFPAPKEEASEEEKSLEQSIMGKKLKYKAPEEATQSVPTAGPACKLRMTVSGGFYVRSLCYDLGLELESGAYMAELVRTKQGDFGIEDAVEWEEFVEGGAWEEKVVRILENSVTRRRNAGLENKVEESSMRLDDEVNR